MLVRLDVAGATSSTASCDVRTGRPSWPNLEVTPFPACGDQAVLCTVRDQSREDHSHGTLRDLIRSLAHLDGPEFFERLVSQLSVSMGMKYVGVCRLHPGEVVETVAFWSAGRLAANFSYGLVGTPCRHVFEGSQCVVPQGVIGQFPEDDDLVRARCRVVPWSSAHGAGRRTSRPPLRDP